MQKKKILKQPSVASSSGDAMMAAAAAAGQTAVPKEKQNPGEAFESSSILWSVSPGSYDDSHAGQLFLYTLCSLGSAKKRAWVVLLDRSLFFYSSSSDIIPQDSAPLRHCVASPPNEEGIITVVRTKGTPTTWYLYSPIQQQRNVWWRMFEEVRQQDDKRQAFDGN